MELQNSLLSNINDNGNNNEKKKKERKIGREYLKTRVVIFQEGRKYMRRILKCTCINIDLHLKNLHPPKP